VTATRFLLVRHAAHDNVGAFLAGRECDVSLGAGGMEQAERLAERLTREDFAVVWCSPRRRTRQTADRIAARKRMVPEIMDGLDEIDFGAAWCGRGFDDLQRDEQWRRWNAARSLTATPAGDTIIAVQARALGVVEAGRRRFPGRSLLMVTHADVIKSLVAFHLGLGPDSWPRFDVAPASLSIVETDDWGARVLGLNEIIW
jgi:broad specificity phosphatase PhoE